MIHRSPLIYSAIQAAGGQAIGAGAVVDFDTEQFPLAGITFSGGNTFTVGAALPSNTWLLSYHVTLSIAGSVLFGTTSLQGFVLLNGGEYAGTRTGANGDSGRAAGLSAAGIPIVLTPGNTLQIQLIRTTGGDVSTVVANGARLTLERVQ